MKKIVIQVLPLLFVALTGCGNNDGDTPESSSAISSTTTETSSIVSTQTSEQATTTTKESTSSSTVAETSETKTEADPDAELRSAYPNVNFPTDIPHKDGNVVNIASDGDETKLSVLYFDMETPLILNNKALNAETPMAQYQKNTYGSSDEAKNAIEVTGGQQGANEVDLGYGITGQQEGAAGSVYTSWQEGNWYLTVRASNVEGQDGVALAKQVVEYLESASLPAPDEVGQITLDMAASDYKANEVTWQVGSEVYSIHHQDPISALKMAVSTQN